MAKAKSAAVAPGRVLAKRRAEGITRANDGKILAAGFGPQQVALFDVASGKKLGGFGSGQVTVCWYAEQSSRGLVAAGFGDGTLRTWDPATDEQTTLAKLGGIVASVAWSADGRYLFAGNCGDNTVRLFDVKTARCIGEGRTKKSGTWFVALAPDARRAVSGAGDKLIHVWDPRAGQELAALAGHTGKINFLAMYPDGRRVASASQDRTVRVWDLDTGKQLFQLDGHTKEVGRVALSPDGRQLASTSTDGTMRFWNAAHGTLEGVLAIGKLTSGAGADYTSDGGTIVVASANEELRALPSPARPRTGMSRDELFAAVWATPDDDAPREVLADWLLEQDDPRGELIGLQLARARGSSTVATRARERELVKEHRREWLGPLAPFVGPTSVKFERGFVVSCTLRAVKESVNAPLHPAWSTVKRFIAPEGSPPRLVAHLEKQGAVRDQP